ncbi:MAG: histidine phosphatase family protein [Bryobacteraceae bacterium]
MPNLFVVRHAEPEMRGVMLGRTDSPLSAAGRAAAAQLALLQPAIVYSSPLRRARETAAYIDAPLEILYDLSEVSYGEWEGRTWEEIEAGWPHLAQQKLEHWLSVPAPGGETWEEVQVRAARALQRVRSGPFPAIVVAHFGINSEFLRQAAGIDPIQFKQAYCEVFPVTL